MFRKWLARGAFGLIILLIVASVGLATWEPFFAEKGEAPPADQYRAEIIRDDFGVPHVYGKTDADAVFGMLYAQAEDDFPRVERNYIWATGRLAEVDGEAAEFDLEKEQAEIDALMEKVKAQGLALQEDVV